MQRIEEEKKEVAEFIEILHSMTDKEKYQLKGIMLGIQLSKTQDNKIA